MAIFEYKALDKSGKSVKGTVDADTERAARNKLKNKGLFPTDVIESLAKESKTATGSKSINFSRNNVSAAQLGIMTRQLGTLTSAGMPLVEALRATAEQIDHLKFQRIIVDIADTVNEGSTLANALKNYPKIFPRLYTNMVSSGESSGSLDLVLDRLADLLENQAALKRKIISSLSYPILMLVLCCGVIMLLLAYVVPQITAIFEDQGMALPLPTRIVIALSQFTKNYWWLILIALVSFVILLKRYSSTAKGKKKIDGFLLKLPLIGSLTLKIATSRFAKNLSTMLASGIELLTALGIAKNIVGNTILEEGISESIEGVREGKDLANELKRQGIFPKLLIHMVAIGEKTGELDSMLNRAANSYESEINAFITSLTSILEPVMILFLALIVGGILASVMLPMLEMTSMAGA